MEQSTLIVRLDRPEAFGNPVLLRQGDAAFLVSRLGEPVVFGLSDVAGIWTCLGEGRLADIARHNGRAVLLFDDILRYPQAVMGTSIIDSGLAGDEGLYAIEEMAPDEWARVQRRAAEERALPQQVAAGLGESEGVFTADTPSRSRYARVNAAPWADCAVARESQLYRDALERYGYMCCLSGLPLHAAPSGEREGFVVPVYPRAGHAPEAVCDVIAVTGTVGFFYVHGLIALTEGLTLWLHPRALPAEIAWLMRRLNPDLRANLPSAPADWPNRDLLRQHLDASRS